MQYIDFEKFGELIADGLDEEIRFEASVNRYSDSAVSSKTFEYDGEAALRPAARGDHDYELDIGEASLYFTPADVDVEDGGTTSSCRGPREYTPKVTIQLEDDGDDLLLIDNPTNILY